MINLNKVRICFYTIFLLFCFANIHAVTINNFDKDFDLNLAKKKFSDINAKLSTQKLDLQALESSIEVIIEIQDEAKLAIADVKDQIEILDRLLIESKIDGEVQKEGIEYKYIENKKKFYNKKISEYRLFVIQAEETIIAYKKIIEKHSALYTFKKSMPIWNIFDPLVALSFQSIDLTKMYQISGIDKFNVYNFAFLITLTFLVLFFAFYLKKILSKSLQKKNKLITDSFYRAIHSYIIPIAIFSLLTIFTSLLYLNITPNPTFELLSYAFLGYFILLLIYKFLFCAKAARKSILGISASIGKVIDFRLKVATSILLIGYLGAVIFRNQIGINALIEISRAIYLILLSISLVWVSWVICNFIEYKRKRMIISLSTKIILSLLLIVMIATECIGYHQLAVFLTSSITYSILLIIPTLVILRIIDVFFKHIRNPDNIAYKKLHDYLGVEVTQKIIELAIIKTVIYLIIATTFIIIIMRIWGASKIFIDQIRSSIFKGFDFFGIWILPSRLITALFAFCVIYLLGRAYATYIAKNRQFKGERDTQVAVSSIIHYIAFSIALLIALLISGVDFTGLAIIASALSVGIGLGMQNIVNNFVSGVTLLIEKPFKPGDRILVGDIEGFVKRVRIRSTQITTIEKEDVIFPNSYLIANQVTNYMFKNRLWRVTCSVGVVYGTNVDLVKKILTEVAKANSDVLDNNGNEPFVFFKNFGNSSLEFEFWCIIDDVNKKYTVHSDLNFAINKAFKANNITIAFPQRDIHIKNNNNSFVKCIEEIKKI